MENSLYNTGVRAIIDDYLLEESKKVRDYGDYWSASSAGYCMRKLTFERLGVPKTSQDDARKQRVFSAGHTFHDWIQKLTKDAGVSIAQELELKDEQLKVIGHFDDLIKVPVYGLIDPEGSVAKEEIGTKIILYDYKTANSKSFGYKNSVSYFHRMQVGTYLYMLRKTPQFSFLGMLDAPEDHPDLRKLSKLSASDLSEARILIIEKDTLRTKEFQVLWDKELALDVHNYWTTLNDFWNKNKLPPCTCAEHEGGFMAKEQKNDYFYNGQPCSLELFKRWQESNKNG